MNRRVAITGIGVVSPIGQGRENFFNSLMAGRSGIRKIEAPFAHRLAQGVGGQIVDFKTEEHFPNKLKSATLDRFSQFALVAAKEAFADAGLELTDAQKERTGVSMGTGLGGNVALEECYDTLFRRDQSRLPPFTVIKVMNNAASGNISLEYSLQGPNLTYSTACASSGLSIGEAYRQIKHGYADIMVAGGAEALLTQGTITAWEALRTLAPADATDIAASCRPFSKDRLGLVLGEGAGIVILEEMDAAKARGAKIYAELAGYGTSSDANHITKPHAPGQARAMRTALADAHTTAGVAMADIGHINAHGTATQVGDVEETSAIKMVFGEAARRIAVSSTKSMHGHLMGATGAVEFIAAVLALQQQAVPPTAHLRAPDPECDLDYVPNIGRTGVLLKAVMSNSFAFGGSNAVLIAARV